MDREKLRRRLIGIFLGELPTHCEVLRNAIDRAGRGEVTSAEDRANFRRAAHSIKGAARSVGCPEIEEVGLQLERMLGNLIQEERGMNEEERQTCARGLTEIERARLQLEKDQGTPEARAAS